MAETVKTNPWDPMPGEPKDTYAAFQQYLLLDVTGRYSERTLSETARRVKKHRQTLEKWAVKWDWKSRAYQWDVAKNQQIFANEISKEKQRLNGIIAKKHKVGTALEGLMLKAMSRLDRKMDADPDFFIPPRDVAALLELGFALQSTEIPILQEAERRKTGIEQLADSLKQLATATLKQAATQHDNNPPKEQSGGAQDENNNSNSNSGDER
jgi:hypothetical protein